MKPLPEALGARDTVSNFNDIRSRLADNSLVASAIVAIPALASSIYRVVDIGWIPPMTVHCILAVLIVVMAILRKRLPYSVRSTVVIAIFFVLGAAALISSGLATNGRALFIAASVLTVLFFGIREGAMVFALSVAFIFATFLLIQNGTIVHNFDVYPLITPLSAWITAAFTLLLLFAAICVPMSILLRQLHLALERSEVDRARLAKWHETSEAFFTSAFHSSPLALSVSDPVTGQFHEVNQTCLDLSGYTREELFNDSSLALGIWSKAEERKALIEGLKTKGMVREMDVTLRSKDGRLHDVLLTAHLIPTERGDRVLAIGQDITRLKELSRMKSEFISIVSHELRTPLTSIVGALKLVQTGSSALAAQRDQLLSVALKNSTRLTELVNDLLDLDKIQSKAMTFQMEKVDLADIASDAIEQSQTFAGMHGVRLVAHEPFPSVAVCGDKFRLHQVVLNLLSNAAKFSPPQSEVTVSIIALDGYGRIEVADRGPGIPASFKAQLFDRFTQVDSTDTRASQGSGLGLNICKSIVDAHKGRIDFYPNGDSGTVFHIDIPLWTNVAERRPESLHQP